MCQHRERKAKLNDPNYMGHYLSLYDMDTLPFLPITQYFMFTRIYLSNYFVVLLLYLPAMPKDQILKIEHVLRVWFLFVGYNANL